MNINTNNNFNSLNININTNSNIVLCYNITFYNVIYYIHCAIL